MAESWKISRKRKVLLCGTVAQVSIYTTSQYPYISKKKPTMCRYPQYLALEDLFPCIFYVYNFFKEEWGGIKYITSFIICRCVTKKEAGSRACRGTYACLYNCFSLRKLMSESLLDNSTVGCEVIWKITSILKLIFYVRGQNISEWARLWIDYEHKWSSISLINQLVVPSEKTFITMSIV